MHQKERRSGGVGGMEESRRDREREIVSGIRRSWSYCHTLQQQRIGWHRIKTLKLMIQI